MGGVTAVAFIPGYKERVHVSGAASSLAVTVDEAFTSDGARNEAVLPQGEAAHNPKQAHGAGDTLIAVGTQAGKVMVFNTLGLLVYEIAMDGPAISVEWVGDMSAPPSLPTRSLSLYPEQISTLSAFPLLDVSQASLSRVRQTEQENESDFLSGVQRKLPPDPIRPMARPSINESSVVDAHQIGIPSRHSRERPLPKPKYSAIPYRARRTRYSNCCSSRQSSSSDRDFFTAPSTRYPSIRQDKGKGKAVESLSAQKKLDVDEDRGMALFMSAGTISPSPEHEKKRKRDGPVARSAKKLTSAVADESQFAAAAVGPSSRIAPAPKNSFSPSQGFRNSTPDIGASQLAVQHGLAKRSTEGGRKTGLLDHIDPDPIAEASSSQGFSSSIYSRSKSRMLHRRPKALDGGADADTPMPQDLDRGARRSFSFEAGLHDFEALGERRHMTSKSVVWTGGKREEISRLRNDNAALRQEMSSLRNEFRVLKRVLLRAESQRRWQECIS
ncbi:hypothetical protein OPT61_g10715 [Boeremia exigua]|uniref:Uncharacterized protein n=1 Tax=Boeremia exigua TaxID=749465 RepID=A0ACC2HP05_9PLEO|nr:hypothetical protein OPT61_g10715 [Boeremia exigua]